MELRDTINYMMLIYKRRVQGENSFVFLLSLGLLFGNIYHFCMQEVILFITSTVDFIYYVIEVVIFVVFRGDGKILLYTRWMDLRKKTDSFEEYTRTSFYFQI